MTEIKKRKSLIDHLVRWTAVADLIVLLLLFLVNLFGWGQMDGDTDVVSKLDGADDMVSQAQEIGNIGNLKVTLMWDFEGDIDLHVIEPSGREIYYRNPQDPTTGGTLDVDNQAGGTGSAENIYWANPPSGVYKIFLFYYQPSRATGAIGSGDCNVVVMQEGKSPKTYSVPMNSVSDRKVVTSITIQ